MKRFGILLALLALLVTTGCVVTSTVTFEPAPEGTVSSSGSEILGYAKVYNNGVFLFYYLPVWSGNQNRPNQRKYKLFQNRLREKHAHMMLENLKETVHGTRIEDVDIRESASGFLTLWILWRRYIYARAAIIK